MLVGSRYGARVALLAMVLFIAAAGVPRGAQSYDKCDNSIDSEAGEKPFIEGAQYFVLGLGIAQKYCAAAPTISSSTALTLMSEDKCGPGTELYNLRKEAALLLDGDLATLLMRINFLGSSEAQLEEFLEQEGLQEMPEMSPEQIDDMVRSWGGCEGFLAWHKELVANVNAIENDDKRD